MSPFPTFSEYLERRSSGGASLPDHGLSPVDERSITGGMFKAVNPARPVSPTNSRLFALPGRKRFKSQIMGV
jgi:hypothetical protein